MKKHIVHKPSPLICVTTERMEGTLSCPYRFSVVQQRAFNILIDAVKHSNTDEYTYEIDFNLFRKLCNDGTNNPIEFFNNVSSIAGIYFIFDGRKSASKIVYGKYSLITSIELLRDEENKPRTIRFKVTDFFKHLFSNITYYNYAHIDQNIVNNLQSVYAISLYETLTDYAGAEKYPKMTVKEFRHLIKVDPDSYKDIRRFREHVLLPMRNKVNAQLTNHSYDFKLYKEHGEYYIEWVKLPKIKEIPYVAPPVEEPKIAKNETINAPAKSIDAYDKTDASCFDDILDDM